MNWNIQWDKIMVTSSIGVLRLFLCFWMMTPLPLTQLMSLSNFVVPEPKGSSPYSQEFAISHYSEPTQFSSPPKAVSLRPVFIPSSNLRLSLLSSSFLRALPPNILHFSVLSHACHMPHPPHSPWFDLPNHIWKWVPNMNSFPRSKVRPGRDADHSPPSSAEVVNE
jgi:hypothetical protein